MPALSMFFGIIIYMYSEQDGQHNAPHIHARYQGDEVVLSLDGEVLSGRIPPKKLRMVRVWIDIHAEELSANWALLQDGQPAFHIDPLR